MNPDIVRIGTRTSVLAMAQTNEVLALLRAARPEVEFKIVPITPEGDRRKAAPMQSMGRGMFAKGIEEALLDGRVDIAVHSAKDLPTELPEGLVIAAYPKRGDARDVIVNRWGVGFMRMPPGARIGTSSPRRSGQFLAARPDIEIVPVRGNVDTRLGRVGDDDLDGVALAAAGLARLGRLSEATEILSPELCAPDAGQGALAVEIREDDARARDMAAVCNHPDAWASVSAERAFVEATGGGCRVPVAAYAVHDGEDLDILAMACLPDGSRIFRERTVRPASDPESAGRAAAAALMKTGADSIMYADAVR